MLQNGICAQGSSEQSVVLAHQLSLLHFVLQQYTPGSTICIWSISPIS